MTKERTFLFKGFFAQLTLVYILIIMQYLVVFFVSRMIELLFFFPFEPGPRNTRKSFKM